MKDTPQEVTLLSHSAFRNQVGFVSWLLQQDGICLNVPVSFKNGLSSALIIAARGGHAEIINMLIAATTKCKLDLKLFCGCPFAKPHGAIWHAAYEGHRSALSLLLQHQEGDLSQLQEAYFWLADSLITSLSKPASDSIKMLLTDEFKNKIALSGRNSEGDGVLYIAAKHERWRNFGILLEHHAHDVEDLNHSLFEVVNHGHVIYLKKFLQPPLKDVIDLGAHDSEDYSLLEIAFGGRIGCIRPPLFTECVNHHLTAGLLMMHHNYPKEQKDALFKKLKGDLGDLRNPEDLREVTDCGRWDALLCILQVMDDPKDLNYVARQAALADQDEIMNLLTL
ncbi:unnamed protein product [Meganyctiphanes norvegica]|uniref:Uncharacterized protein n=1 Tax=Meganyctiphanes norvegica TaxID=48144 RepID=A0AAV2RNN4_MEGNR